MKCLILLLCCINPVETIAVDRTDVLLYERVYDGDGRLVFTQLCPLDWNPHCERYDYVCWRLESCKSLKPERDWRRGGYVVRFVDGDVPRIIRAGGAREEFNQFDSEVAAREVLPKEYRRGLSK